MTDFVIVEQADSILNIRFNRPDKYNALTTHMYDKAREAMEAAQSDDSVRVIYISAEGSNFSAGNDIADFLQQAQTEDDGSDQTVEDRETPAFKFIKTLARNGKPMVAAVQGKAVGIGTTMLLHADAVFARPDAEFSVPFVQLGLVPEAAASLLLPRRIGELLASEMLMTGRKLGADEAAAAGLINACSDDYNNLALQAAKNLTQLSPEALRQTRQLLRPDVDTLLARIDREGVLFDERMRSDECKAVFARFLSR